MPVGDALPEISLVVAAVAALLLASFVEQRRHGACALVALAGLAVAAALSLLEAGGAARLSFRGSWALDGATTAARLAILAFTALVTVLAPAWLREDRRHGEYYAVLLLSALGALLLAGAADTMELVVAVLLSSVTGFTLAAYHRDWALSVEAGMKYFLVGALANALLVTGVVLLFGVVGDTGYGATAGALAAGGTAGVRWSALAAVAFAVVGLSYKLAAFPAHAWLPDVAEGSPAPSAAFLAVVPKIGALVALARLAAVLPEGLVPWRVLVAALAVATMTLGNLGALWQTDVRRLLGWSSVSQSGYALVAVAVLGRSELALPGLLFFLLGYGAATLAAFAVVVHLRGRTDLEDFRGLGHERPGAAAALAVAFLSLVGVPPLAGFVGKLTVFAAAIEGGYAWLAVVAVANTVASLFYYLRVLGPVYFEGGRAAEPVATLGRWPAWALALATAATVGLGLAADLVLAPLARIALLP